MDLTQSEIAYIVGLVGGAHPAHFWADEARVALLVKLANGPRQK